MDLKDVRFRPSDEVDRIPGRYMIHIHCNHTGGEFFKSALCASSNECLELFGATLKLLPKRCRKEIMEYRPSYPCVIFEAHAEGDFYCMIEASELKSREEFDQFKRLADAI